MLFHEVYGSYYDVTAAVLREAVRGTLTPEKLTALVRKKAFSESLMTLPDGLRGERWRLLGRDLSTPIEEPPTLPLTLLQKRWLKALLLDPRIRLFGPDDTGLEDVEPLFAPDTVVYFDRYSDGDDYADPGYIARFRAILAALREKKRLALRFGTGHGGRRELEGTPLYLEYSEKDDRFRLVLSTKGVEWVVNLSRLESCAPIDAAEPAAPHPCGREVLCFELTDERNALERVLLHFSHLQKETEQLDALHYRVKLYYDRRDETEMLIRILSFGPTIRVTDPPRFVELLRRRIARQAQYLSAPSESGKE